MSQTIAATASPLKLKIAGMDCGSCAITIENSIRKLPGVEQAEVSFTTESLEVTGPVSKDLIESRLHELGYNFAAYPLTLMSAAMKAIQASLAEMARREHPADRLLDFADLRKAVGFDAYYEAEKSYSDNRD